MGDFSQISVSFSEYLNFINVFLNILWKSRFEKDYRNALNRLNLAFSKTNLCFSKNGPSKQQQYSKHFYHPANNYVHSWVKIFHNSDLIYFQSHIFQSIFCNLVNLWLEFQGTTITKLKKIAFKKIQYHKKSEPILTYVCKVST